MGGGLRFHHLWKWSHWSGGCSSALKIIWRDKWISAEGVWRGSQLTMRLRCHPISRGVGLILAPCSEEGAAVASLLARLESQQSAEEGVSLVKTDARRSLSKALRHREHAHKAQMAPRSCLSWSFTPSQAAAFRLKCSSAAGRTWNKAWRRSQTSRGAPAPSKEALTVQITCNLRNFLQKLEKAQSAAASEPVQR